jgi:Protein kinase domain
MPLRNCAPLKRAAPDKYALAETLHEGRGSAVYRGRRNADGVPVVIKRFEPARHRAYVREVGAAFGVSHPNVVRCLDTFYAEDARPCIVYEYFERGTLRQWLDGNGAAKPSIVYACLRDLLHGLDHLHRLQRVHCDLKAENVYLRARDGEPLQFVLGDLGASCSLAEARTGRHGAGTPAYVAPERLYDRFFFNSDIYALGILGFELCAGHRPFLGSPRQVMRAHLSAAAPLLEITEPALRALLERLLEKDPAARVQDAQSALTLLDACAGGCLASATQQPHGAPSEPSRPARAATAPIARLVERSRFPLDEPPQALLAFNVDGRPVVGLERDSRIDLVDPERSLALRMILKSGPAQLCGPERVAYATTEGVFACDLRTQRSVSLLSGATGIKAFHTDGSNLIWRNRHGFHYYAFGEINEAAFRVVSYLLETRLALFGDGKFCHSDGVANQTLVFRDAAANFLASRDLGGSIVALTGANDCALALTLDVAGAQRSALWRVSARRESEKLDLSGTVVRWCNTPGHVFWLDRQGQLFMSGEDLQARALGAMPEAVTTLSVSVDHRFVCAASAAGAWLTVWETSQIQ